MTRSRLFLLCLPALCLFTTVSADTARRLRLRSPRPTARSCSSSPSSAVRSRHAISASVNDLRYAVDFHGKWLMDESALGLKIEGQPALGPGMKQVHAESGQHDESYTIPVGKTSSVRDHYNSAHVDLPTIPGRKLSLEVRAFDDGIAFRYIVPAAGSTSSSVRIEHELHAIPLQQRCNALSLDPRRFSDTLGGRVPDAAGQRHPSRLAHRFAFARRSSRRRMGCRHRGRHR